MVYVSNGTEKYRKIVHWEKTVRVRTAFLWNYLSYWESWFSSYSKIINEFSHLFSLVKSIKIISLKKPSLAYQLLITWDPCLNNSKTFYSYCYLDRPFVVYVYFYKIYWILPFSSFASLGIKEPCFLKTAYDIIERKGLWCLSDRGLNPTSTTYF